MPYRLLIADDSPLYRLRLSQVFAASDQLQLVGLAGDGREAVRLLKERQAEVLVLDLEMPEMDGFSVLRWAMRHAPLPIVVCSGQSERESVFQALEAGAVDFITKPELRHALRSEAFARELRQRVEAAAVARAHICKRTKPDVTSLVAAARIAQGREQKTNVVGIVGSAGGPAAVTQIVAQLSREMTAPILIALHMPPGFTRSFAERLARVGSCDVREARDGEALAPARILIAPGGHHTLVNEADGVLRLTVAPAQASDPYAPSADRLLASLAEACGPRALGVILTGMGEDGLAGARALRAAGGHVLVEARDSAVIWGMPRAVAEAGLAHAELSLPAIAAALPLLCERA